MIKITKTYTDFDGVERTETAWFNMTKSQLIEFSTELPEGVIKSAEKNDPEVAVMDLIGEVGEKGILSFLKELLLRSYGIRGEDGRSFKKSAAISEEFAQTILFDEIFMDLMSDNTKMDEFFNNVIPADLASKAEQLKATKSGKAKQIKAAN